MHGVDISAGLLLSKRQSIHHSVSNVASVICDILMLLHMLGPGTLASVLSSYFMCAMMVQTRVHRVTRRPMAKSMPPLQLLLDNAFGAVPTI